MWASSTRAESRAVLEYCGTDTASDALAGVFGVLAADLCERCTGAVDCSSRVSRRLDIGTVVDLATREPVRCDGVEKLSAPDAKLPNRGFGQRCWVAKGVITQQPIVTSMGDGWDQREYGGYNVYGNVERGGRPWGGERYREEGPRTSGYRDRRGRDRERGRERDQGRGSSPQRDQVR